MQRWQREWCWDIWCELLYSEYFSLRKYNRIKIIQCPFQEKLLGKKDTYVSGCYPFCGGGTIGNAMYFKSPKSAFPLNG